MSIIVTIKHTIYNNLQEENYAICKYNNDFDKESDHETEHYHVDSDTDSNEHTHQKLQQ